MSLSGASPRSWLAVLPGIVTAFSLLALTPSAATAQAYDLVERARHLEATGELWAAASTLRAHLWIRPQDAHVRWPLGRLLYWMGDTDGAMAEYDLAREALPDEPWLAVDRARIFMDISELDSARVALQAAVDRAEPESPASTEATALLGTLAYWAGDYSRAVKMFEDVLEEQPGRVDTRRQLDAIRSTMRPWFGLGMELVDDNQPYRRVGATLVGGRYITPLWTVAVGGTPRNLDGAEAGTASEAWVQLAGFVPGMRTDASVTMGRAWQASLAGRDAAWIGDVILATRIASDVKLRARRWTERYLWTSASADTLVVADGLELALDGAAAPGWAGEVVLRHEGLPGENTILTAYAWGLAPVAPRLRVGYSFAWQDSEASRWLPVETDDTRGGPGRGMGPPVGGSEVIGGIYSPYFTPLDTYVHSLLAELRGSLGPGTARLNASYGVWARELAPSLQVVGVGANATTQTVFEERRFTPWTLTGAVDIPRGCCLSVQAEVERGHTAFYRMTRLSLGIVYRFLRAPSTAGP